MSTKRKLIVGGLVLYYGCYSVLIAFVEPFGWFGKAANGLTRLGVLGHIGILVVPGVIAVGTVLWLMRRQGLVEDYSGIVSVSTGPGRDDAFQQVRDRARQKIVIVGIGMTKLSKYARTTLARQAEQVPIEFLMIDPDVVHPKSHFTQYLEEFLDIRDFSRTVRSSFDALETFCDSWNDVAEHRHHLELRVYRTIPSFSMVMVDGDTESGELVVEFFLYQSGEHRPRLHIRKSSGEDNLFALLRSRYDRLWSDARKVV